MKKKISVRKDNDRYDARDIDTLRKELKEAEEMEERRKKWEDEIEAEKISIIEPQHHQQHHHQQQQHHQHQHQQEQQHSDVDGEE